MPLQPVQLEVSVDDRAPVFQDFWNPLQAGGRATKADEPPPAAVAKVARQASQAVGKTASHARNTPVRQLTSEVANNLLRGVRLERALQGFARHWADSPLSVELGDQEYALSDETLWLDDFVSHDWHTGRWVKFIALCIVYNGHVAVAGSLAASFAAGILQAMSSPDSLPIASRYWVGGTQVKSPSGYAGLLVGPIVFLSLLLFWQRIRVHLLRRKPCLVFFDKLCIHQTDVERKAEAIMSLAGFLRESGRLVVLWSPRYLKRLWCVYEVATWVHLNESRERPTQFVPVMLATGLVTCSLCPLVFGILLTLWEAVSVAHAPGRGGSVTPLPLLVLLALGSLSLVFPAHAVRNLVRELKCMPEHLTNFSVRDADCHCCEHNHRHPVTGEELACDRQLVYSMLLRWFGDKDNCGKHALAESEVHLDRFDQCVRTDFAQKLLRTMRVDRMGYWQALVVCQPVWWYTVNRIAPSYFIYKELGLEAAARYLGEYLLVAVVSAPLTAEVFWRCSFSLDRLCAVQKNTVADAMVTLTSACAFIAFFILLYGPVLIARCNAESPWLQVVFTLIECIFGLLVFCSPCFRWEAPQKELEETNETTELPEEFPNP